MVFSDRVRLRARASEFTVGFLTASVTYLLHLFCIEVSAECPFDCAKHSVFLGVLLDLILTILLEAFYLSFGSFVRSP